jgi:hypothetical protein
VCGSIRRVRRPTLLSARPLTPRCELCHRNLDEIFAGEYEGMTYAEIEAVRRSPARRRVARTLTLIRRADPATLCDG